MAYQRTDVTQLEDLRALVDLATRRFGRLDVLASIAGLAINAPLASDEVDDWDQMIDVNLRGVLHGIAAALPVFRSQQSGHLLTVASTSAYKRFPARPSTPPRSPRCAPCARSCDRNWQPRACAAR